MLTACATFVMAIQSVSGPFFAEKYGELHDRKQITGEE